jgi:hypothetical protein
MTRREWRATGERANVPVLEVEIVCSDVEEHRRRVESREPDIDGHVLPTWRDVEERDYRPWNSDRLVVDTAHQPMQAAIDAIVARSRRLVTPSPGPTRSGSDLR